MKQSAAGDQRDFAERVRLVRRRTKLRRLTWTLFTVFLVIFLVSAGCIAFQLYQDWQDAQSYADLSELVTEHPETTPTASDTVESVPETNPETEPVQPSEPQILAKYQKVYSMNQDLFGWIHLEGTVLNYPVMHTPEDEEYYLRRGFDHSYARSGVPFLDAECTTGCGNYLIYGHNMTNGTMFASLTAYDERTYWEDHPVIHFDTLYEKGEYEVISAFYSRVFYKYETNVFRYYNYHDLTDPDVYREYVEQVKSLSIYDTGIEPEVGDQLITLITCSYGMKHERFVVVARKQP